MKYLKNKSHSFKVLQAVLLLYPKAYLITIAYHAKCKPGACYNTLKRLEKKGWIESWQGQPIKRQGGKSITYYTITNLGVIIFNERRE